MTAKRIYPVVLSGGSGTRLWPLSRSLYPKQLLPLVSKRTMLQETISRVTHGDIFAAPLVVCNEQHRFIIAEQLRALDVTPRALMLEPVGRNTAPAVACAASFIARDDPEAILLVLPSDHAISAPTAFMQAVHTAQAAAVTGALVTFGIEPTRPETGYGYIRRGRAYETAAGPVAGCYHVDRFVEKPDVATAERMLAEGGYVWNSGIFMLPAVAYIEELRRFEPDIAAASQAAVVQGTPDLDFFRIDAKAFSESPAKSIDYAVMERTERAAIVPVEMGWSDVGSWSALWEISEKDWNGNVRKGDIITHDSRGAYIHSDGPLVCAVGVENVAIVATEDAVLVVDKKHAQSVGDVVKQMVSGGRNEPHSHLRVYRPWGSYQTICKGDRFQVKLITVKPGGRLSLQKHHRRAEHWVVVSGRAHVVRGTDDLVLEADESTYIPLGTVHRLENRGAVDLELIEVQTGDYLGEDDIVRLEDVYGR